MSETDTQAQHEQSFAAACEHRLTFGKYEGKTIAEVGESREGVLYLDWVITRNGLDPTESEHIKAYLRDKSVALRVYEALDADDD